jgi:hypothetical protein
MQVVAIALSAVVKGVAPFCFKSINYFCNTAIIICNLLLLLFILCAENRKMKKEVPHLPTTFLLKDGDRGLKGLILLIHKLQVNAKPVSAINNQNTLFSLKSVVKKIALVCLILISYVRKFFTTTTYYNNVIIFWSLVESRYTTSRSLSICKVYHFSDDIQSSPY